MMIEEIYARMPKGVVWIEDPMRWDFIAYFLDESNWQKYSRNGYPIWKDEMCREWMPGTICKVKLIRDGKGPFDYHYEVLSSRPDEE